MWKYLKVEWSPGPECESLRITQALNIHEPLFVRSLTTSYPSKAAMQLRQAVAALALLLLGRACAAVDGTATLTSGWGRPAREQLYMFIVGSYKLDNVTWEEFADYLVHVHSHKARPIIKRHGVSKWTQVYNSSPFFSPSLPPSFIFPAYLPYHYTIYKTAFRTINRK